MASKKQKEEVKETSRENIDTLMASLQDKYGEGSIMKLGDVRHVDVSVIPTGSFSLDIALGVGGLPRGRVVEIFGPEGSGKKTLALNVGAHAQKKRRKG